MTETVPAAGGALQRSSYTTKFGSLEEYEKGGVELIADDARHYAFSNVFEVAATTPAWDRVAVAKNFQYVLEAVRAEGTSPWYSNSHDEFALCLDGVITVELRKPDQALVAPETEGSVLVGGEPGGVLMGRIHLKRGHQALLPANAAYRFVTQGDPGVLLMQTIGGQLTQYRWAEICQTV